MKSASVLSVLAAGTIAAISTSVCAGSNGTDAVMRSLDQVNRIYTPEKTTHTELLLRLNDLGCHYRVNNRMKADPEDVMTCKSSKDHSKPRNEVDTSLKSPV